MPLGRPIRLIRLATEIKTNPKTTPQALCRNLGISRSQFYKDKEALKRLGFDFRFSRADHGFRITTDPFLPTQDLTYPERIALVLAIRQFLTFGDYTLGVDALSAVRKLIGQSPDVERDFLRQSLEDAVLRQGFGCKPEVLEALQTATAEHRRVILKHRSIREGRVKTWTVDPCALLFRRRAFYLDGYALEAREFRMFRAGRIEEVKILPIHVPVREDYSLSGRHGGAFSVFPGEKSSRVRVKFDPSIAPFIRESLWHSPQSLTDQPDGGLILDVDVAEPEGDGVVGLAMGRGRGNRCPPGPCAAKSPGKPRAFIIVTRRATRRRSGPRWPRRKKDFIGEKKIREVENSGDRVERKPAAGSTPFRTAHPGSPIG
jgi:predicted DNA-binding transcriptional regulator YafY